MVFVTKTKYYNNCIYTIIMYTNNWQKKTIKKIINPLFELLLIDF